MAVLIVTYDLNKEGQNYTKVLELIRKFPNVQLSESSYAIDTNNSPSSIYDEIKPFIDGNDHLYIITLSNPRMGRHIDSVREWLKVHLK